jgi:hypothetical protein
VTIILDGLIMVIFDIKLGLGQLRHNSNASGPRYGLRLKNSGTLGIYLNM